MSEEKRRITLREAIGILVHKPRRKGDPSTYASFESYGNLIIMFLAGIVFLLSPLRMAPVPTLIAAVGISFFLTALHVYNHTPTPQTKKILRIAIASLGICVALSAALVLVTL